MTLLLIIAAWMLVLSFLAGLCTIARLGDSDQRRRQATATDPRAAEQLPIAVRVSTRGLSVPEREAAARSLAA